MTATVGELMTAGEVRPTSVDDPFEALLAEHWSGLVRLATLLLRGSAQAEDVVQDAVVSCLRSSDRLRDPDKALAYLRRSVVNGANSVLRRRMVALRHLPATLPDVPGADVGAVAAAERDAVVRAIKALPRRQRQAVALRFYADASERQAAAAMGVSVGAVKAYTSRGLAALRESLGDLS